MANGVRSIKAATLTAWSMGIADKVPLSGTFGRDFVEGSSVVLTESDDDDDGASVEEFVVPVRLGLESDLRSVGVSKDSRALGSSNFVYLPIEGLLTT